MNIGANDVSTMLSKSTMVGGNPQLSNSSLVKETDKQRETEKARDADPESSSANDTQTVSTNSGANRSGQTRRFGQDQSLQRLGRGSVQWQDQEGHQGSEWLPPSLRPQAKGAGTSNAFNVPYWLYSKHTEETQEDNPLVAHKRLLNCLKGMVHNDIQQYVRSNNPPYPKRTLREFHSLLSEGASEPVRTQSAFQMSGERMGLTRQNWERQQSIATMFSDPPEPGSGFEMVA
jgi:hypothetical protein